MTIDDPTTATPSEVDEQLAQLGIEHTHAENTVALLTIRVRKLTNDGMTAYATRLQLRIDQARQTMATCEEAMRPLEAEYKRRGGWTRAWLVLNTGGHVHRTMDCRTCFPSTQFAWLTHLSGHDETEIVELAGKAACTECYPSAPAETRNRPSRIKTPDQLAREAEKAERAKAKAAKAITAPDGAPLRTHQYGQIATEFTARQAYADALAYARYLTRADVVRHRDIITQCREDAQLILTALAAKHGRTEDDLRDELASKVERRWTRAYK